MNLRERKRFVRELLKSLSVELRLKCKRMPSEWDGHEIRKYIAERAEQLYWGTMNNDRLKRYENEVLENDL